MKKVKVNKIENGNGFSFGNTPANNRRSKTANIVCQTIQTVDNKTPTGVSNKNSYEELATEKKSPIDQNISQKIVEK